MESSRKAAIREYKERKTARGIFAIRCRATGSVWVESAMDLDMSEKRTWFILTHGDPQIDKSVLAEFREHTRDEFSYEVLEKLDEDVAEMSVRDILKDRKKHWRSELGAKTLWPV